MDSLSLRYNSNPVLTDPDPNKDSQPWIELSHDKGSRKKRFFFRGPATGRVLGKGLATKKTFWSFKKNSPKNVATKLEGRGLIVRATKKNFAASLSSSWEILSIVDFNSV